jgi:hypothetical protein
MSHNAFYEDDENALWTLTRLEQFEPLSVKHFKL